MRLEEDVKRGTPGPGDGNRSLFTTTDIPMQPHEY